MDRELIWEQDALIPYLLNHTDEAQRMQRRGQATKYWNVFQRLEKCGTVQHHDT